MRLKDKVILVTGSTTGIGEGMVRVFAREGAKVMIHGRRKDAAQALASELGDECVFLHRLARRSAGAFTAHRGNYEPLRKNRRPGK